MEEETVPGWGGQAVADVLERGMQMADMRAALLEMEAAESVQTGEWPRDHAGDGAVGGHPSEPPVFSNQ